MIVYSKRLKNVKFVAFHPIDNPSGYKLLHTDFIKDRLNLWFGSVAAIVKKIEPPGAYAIDDFLISYPDYLKSLIFLS